MLAIASHIHVFFFLFLLSLATVVYISPPIAQLNLSHPCHSSLQLLSRPADGCCYGYIHSFFNCKSQGQGTTHMLNSVPLERFRLY